MNLIILHGPPAVGKFTIGRELAGRTGYVLYHNHTVVDEILRHHAFGSPEFTAGRDRAWRTYFEQAAREQPPGIIFTFNPESTVPQAFLDWLFTELPRRHVRIFSIGLTAAEAIIEARIGAVSRQPFRKLTEVEHYRRLRETGAFLTPAMPRTDLVIDTGKSSPAEAAGLAAKFITA